MLGDDLRQCRLETLAVRGDAERRRHRAGRVDAHDRRFGAGIDRHARRDRDARADAGQFGIRRDADAVPAAGGARALLRGAQVIVADRVTGSVETFVKAGFIPDNAGGDLVGQLVGANEIAQSYLARIHAELDRGHIHQPLHDEGRDRPADAAIGAKRRFRGRHAAHPALIIGDAIGPGQKAHHLDRLERRGPRIDRIGADVAYDVGAQRRDMPFAVERDLGVDDLVKALAAREQILHAVRGPFDGARQQPRRGGDENLFGIERTLAAETTADILRDDPHAMAGNIERLRQRIAHDARHLRRRIQCQRLAAGVVFGKVGARLDRNRRLSVHAKPAADAHRRLGKRGVDVAALEFAAHHHVGAGLIVQQRRAVFQRLFRIDHERQRLVFDIDELQRVFGLIAALRDDTDDRLADIAHLAARQRQERCRVVVLHARGRDQNLDVVGKIIGREDGDDAGRRRAPPCNRSHGSAHATDRCGGTRHAARAAPAGRRYRRPVQSTAADPRCA